MKVVRGKQSLALGIALIAIGVLFNKWVIESTVVADRELESPSIIGAIVALQVIAIGSGLFLAIRQPSIAIRRPTRGEFILLIGSTLVAVVMLEAGARLFLGSDYRTPENELWYEPSIFSVHVFPPIERVVKGSDGSEYDINEKGYRGPDFTVNKPQDTIRIIVYGGSTVFDPGATQGRDWPHRVETNLKQLGFPGVEVINAGIPGHASFDSVGRLFSEGHTFDPDYVVLYNAWNDIKYFSSQDNLLRLFKPYDKSRDPLRNYNNRVDRFLTEHSYTYALARYVYYSRVKFDLGFEGKISSAEYSSELSESALRQYRLNVEMFVDLARNIGAEPILVTQARLVTRYNTDDQKSRIRYEYVKLTHDALVTAFEGTDDAIFRVAAAKGVHVIDASEALTGKDEAFLDHAHLTDKGSEELAAIVSSHLADMLRAPSTAHDGEH